MLQIMYICNSQICRFLKLHIWSRTRYWFLPSMAHFWIHVWLATRLKFQGPSQRNTCHDEDVSSSQMRGKGMCASSTIVSWLPCWSVLLFSSNQVLHGKLKSWARLCIATRQWKLDYELHLSRSALRNCFRRANVRGCTPAWIPWYVRIRIARICRVLSLDTGGVIMTAPWVSLGVVHAAAIQPKASQAFYAMWIACTHDFVTNEHWLARSLFQYRAGTLYSDWEEVTELWTWKKSKQTCTSQLSVYFCFIIQNQKTYIASE